MKKGIDRALPGRSVSIKNRIEHNLWTSFQMQKLKTKYCVSSCFPTWYLLTNLPIISDLLATSLVCPWMALVCSIRSLVLVLVALNWACISTQALFISLACLQTSSRAALASTRSLTQLLFWWNLTIKDRRSTLYNYSLYKGY